MSLTIIEAQSSTLKKQICSMPSRVMVSVMALVTVTGLVIVVVMVDLWADRAAPMTTLIIKPAMRDGTIKNSRILHDSRMKSPQNIKSLPRISFIFSVSAIRR